MTCPGDMPPLLDSAPPAEVDCILVLVLILGAALKVVVLIVVAAPELALLLYR